MSEKELGLKIISELKAHKSKRVSEDMAFAMYYNSQVQRRNDCIDECILVVSEMCGLDEEQEQEWTKD